MFSLNLNGIFVLTMSKNSYFLKWGSPPQTAFTAVPLTLQHPLEKAHVVASSSAPFTNKIQDRGAYKYINSPIVSWHILFSGKNTLGQPSIDFDFCNLSSSGDVLYKERWWRWHKLVTDLFYDFVTILLVEVAKWKKSSNWKISVI